MAKEWFVNIRFVALFYKNCMAKEECMNLKQLEYFAAAAECRNISVAAKRLHMTNSHWAGDSTPGRKIWGQVDYQE